GFINSKKNAIIILILSLSLALIPTLSMLTNGFFSTMLTGMAVTGELDQGSIRIQDPDFLDTLDFPEQLTYIGGILNDNGLEYESLDPLLSLSLRKSYFYSNSTLPTDSIIEEEGWKDAGENYARINPNFEFRDPDFFISSTFGERIEIIEGTYPTSQDEFLIDWRIGQKFNLSSGSVFNLTLRLNRDPWDPEYSEAALENGEYDYYYENYKYTELNVSNFTICGFYLEKRVYDSDWDYSYEDYEENETYDVFGQDNDKYYFYNSIYSTYNFSLSKSQVNHPVLQLFDNIGNMAVLNNKSSPYFYDVERYLYFGCYVVFQTNIDSINLNSLQKESRVVMDQYQQIQSDLGTDYRLYWDMYYMLPDMAMIFLIARIVIAVINLPILLFVVSLGILSARVIRKSRVPDYLRLRIKGLTRKMVSRQSTIEALINGLLACLLSIAIGLGLFYLLRGEILQLLETLTGEGLPFDPSDMKPKFLWIDLLNTMFWGFSCSMIMYIPIFYYNRKLSLADLVAVKEAKDLPVIYDEVTVYDKDIDQVSLNWREFLQLDDDGQINRNVIGKSDITQRDGLGEVKIGPDQEIDNESRQKDRKKSSKKRISRKSKKSRISRKSKKSRKSGKITPIYEDFIKQYEKKIPKIALILIIVGIFPILASYSLFYFLDHNPPDFLYDIVHQINDYGFQYIFMIVSILSPFLIITGLIRFVGIEKPSRFAKLSKFLSTPILGPLNSLFGLKMISSKELVKWIRVFTIFASIMISINMLTNSAYNYQVISDNLLIGADVKLDADIDLSSGLYPDDFLTQTENLLTNLTNENNQTYVNSVVTCQKISGKMDIENTWVSDTATEILSVNISRYLEIIQDDQKILPNPTIVETIEELETHQQQYLSNSSILPGIILSQEFERFYLPDYFSTIKFNISYFNLSSGLEFEKKFEFEIIGVLGIAPGLVENNDNYNRYWDSRYFALLDQSVLKKVNCVPIYNHIYQLLDINRNLAPNSTTITENISSSIDFLLSYDSVIFYNQDGNLNNQELLSLFSIFQIVEIVLYFLAVVLAVSLGLLLNAIKNNDDRFYSLLYTRGYGKKGAIKILLSQIFVMFVIGSVIGTICGYFIPSIFISTIQEQYEYSFHRYYRAHVTFSLPIFWEPVKILSILTGILAVAVGIFFTINFLKRQNLNKNLQQF
ncbi:MAG: FtsX-like permease family protein, partial [Promethearchaeota archaeon]